MQTEIQRTIQIEEKTVHIHIHLTDEEARRLLLPHIESVYVSELKRQSPYYYSESGVSTSTFAIRNSL